MKKKLFCIIAVLVIALAVGSFALASTLSSLGDTDEDVRASLLAMEKAEFWGSVKTNFNANANTYDIDSLMSWASILGQREAEFPDDAFLSEIVDTTNS